jgi:hypothetical protein
MTEISMRTLILAAPMLALAACNEAPPIANTTGNAVEESADTLSNLAGDVGGAIANGAETAGNAVAEAVTRDEWVGRWTGVEGTYLVVSNGDAPGRYKLEMQYTLDDKGSFDGTATADGIAFTRPDGAQTLRATDGDATGLKYLAGKKDCLTVKTGEGYCRD